MWINSPPIHKCEDACSRNDPQKYDLHAYLRNDPQKCNIMSILPILFFFFFFFRLDHGETTNGNFIEKLSPLIYNTTLVWGRWNQWDAPPCVVTTTNYKNLSSHIHIYIHVYTFTIFIIIQFYNIGNIVCIQKLSYAAVVSIPFKSYTWCVQRKT